MTTADSADRAPRQARSRESWERVLQAGMDLFAERGWDQLTIAEVCRRADVTPPTIYARVDGKAGLFRAVHDRWLDEVDLVVTELTAEHIHDGAPPAVAAASAARVVLGVFERKGAVLRALIHRSGQDEELLRRGGEPLRGMLAGLAATIPIPPERAAAVTRTVFGECLMRAMYGADFLEPVGESDAAFGDRVIALAQRLAG
ncbi:TetR/AcrR family transcriptional regulator [Microbacterium sp.]|uniref:TetR/AcrR family transcriptional regulator n=1 Tax=Microbacterium sp. TaxID=51671 RepID=UPI003A86D7AE